MRLFISNRGTPQVIISDDAKYFINEEAQTINSLNVKWKFNIEGASWKGVSYERLNRSVKRCLKNIFGNARLDYEQMLTIIKEIKMVLNNRPITYFYTKGDLIEPVSLITFCLEETFCIQTQNDVKIDETNLTKR